MEYFKYKDYERDNTSLLRAYAENQIAHLRRLHPTVPVDKIQKFVMSEIETRLKKPTIEIVDYPSCGNANLVKVDLLSHTQKLRENIITPAGVAYVLPEVKESFLKKKIIANTLTRKAEKKKMFIAKNAGDLAAEQQSNYVQSSIKIETNAIPGAFGSAYNFLSDRPNYNAVTGMARHGIMCGYAHVEKMLEGNYYFPTLEHCINYCIQLVRLCPSDLDEVVSIYELYIPTIEDVTNHFLESFRLYRRITSNFKQSLTRFLGSLSQRERIFVYYAYCLKTLLRNNETFFRPYIKEFFRTDIDSIPTTDPEDIFKFNSDLLAMLSGLNSDIINYKPVSDAIKENPDGVRKMIAIGRHMQERLDHLGRLISTFLRVDCDTPDAMSHPRMIRKTVIISDTDSVIFSTQSWVEWYTGKNSFDRDACVINGFVVFLTIMTLEQVFARLSTNIGAKGRDIHRISMKNEFLYPLMLRTPLPKQYAGRVTIQEGFVLSKPKEDIKGLSFRSSTMCPETVVAGKNFVNWLFDTILKDGTITVSECLEKVLDHELRVIKSLKAGERTFLSTTPIKTEYKKIEASIYYYWLLWEEVFRPVFGEFIIPNKGFYIPILGEGRALKDPRYLKILQEYDSSLYERLIKFTNKNTRKITKLVIPMTLKQIPEILRPIIDVRAIVYSNSTPFFVTMRSLGIGYTNSEEQTLLSDIYTKCGVGCEMDFSG